MEYVRFGNSGLEVSRLCLGAMDFPLRCDRETSRAIFFRAFDAGINFIDTADVYSRWAPGNPGGVAERIIGRWLRTRPERGDEKRGGEHAARAG